MTVTGWSTGSRVHRPQTGLPQAGNEERDYRVLFVAETF